MKNINNNKYENKKNNIPSEKTEIIKNPKNKNEIPILELLKCPICKKICLMNINKDKLLFSFECTNNHNNKNNPNKKFKKCRTNNDSIYSFPSDFSDLNLSKEYNINLNKINNKDNNTSKMTNVTIQKLYITEKDLICQSHPNFKFNSYCFECKKNLCEKCQEEHLNHNQVKLNSIKPNDKEVLLCKKTIKKNEVSLLNLIGYLQNWKKEFDKGLNILIKIMQNIFNLKDFIISNYDPKQNNQNYNYIQNFNNIKALDFIFPELKNFADKKNFKQSGYDIIEAIYNIQNKIAENKQKIINSKNETNPQSQSQLNKFSKNILPKNNNNNDQNDIGSEDTSPSVKNNNFNTTYMSDCNNNNFFSRNVSKSAVIKGSSQTKKKVLGRNKIEKILEDPNISRTIEQNDILEKNNELKNIENKIIEEENNSENKIILKNVEQNNDNITEKNSDKFIFEENKDFNEKNIEKDKEKEMIQNNNLDINSNKNGNNSYNTLKTNSQQNIFEENNIEINNKSENIKNKENNLYSEARNKYIYSGIDLKYELKNTDIIRSIEFLNNEHILISTLENISVYKINSNKELVKEYDIKEFNYRINYATKLSNNNLIICSLNNIDIIKLSEDDLGSYNIIQKLKGKNNSENINKIKEIPEKNYLISCDKNNIILYSKDPETNLYSEKNYIKTNTEVKCLEKINNNLIITVEPEKQKLIIYELDSLKKFYEINNIQSSFGRYVICFIEKYESIFITGLFGIYLISSKNFDTKIFFKVGEWISSINYDMYSNCLICGTWQRNSTYEEKNYNLIIYELIQENLDENKIEDMKIREITRKNNAHDNDIVVIQSLKNIGFITGSNDNTVKLWK